MEKRKQGLVFLETEQMVPLFRIEYKGEREERYLPYCLGPECE